MSSKEFVRAYRELVHKIDNPPTKRSFKRKRRSVSKKRQAPPDSATQYRIGDEMFWNGATWRIIKSGTSRRWSKIGKR
jgi:hypothetical protein